MKENQVVISQLEDRIKKLETLIEATGILALTFNLDNLLDMIMKIGMEMMNAGGCSILLIDEESKKLQFVAASGEKKESLKKLSINIGEGIAGKVAQTGKPLIIKDVSNHPSFSGRIDKKLQQKTHSIICVPLKIKGKIIGVAEVINCRDKKSFTGEGLSLFKSLATQSAIAIERARLYQDLNDLFFSTIETLASAIDAKDHYTQGHSERVSKYSVIIAREMDMTEKELSDVKLSAMLHDIGKIGIPESILQKHSSLTDMEREFIYRHPVLGANILKPIKKLKDIIPGILHHHEKYNGSGYPDRLSADNIPLYAKVICVADSFDAMTSNRPYRKAFSHEESVQEIEKCIGSQFDPVCGDAFLKAYRKGLIEK